MALRPPDCLICETRNCSIMSNCSDDLLKIIDEKKGFFKVRKGQALIHEGMPFEKFYFIHQGKIKVVTTGLYGKQQIKRLAKTGDLVGFRGMAANHTFPASIYALEDSTICHIDKDLFLNTLKSNPNLMFNILLLIAGELYKMEVRMKNLTIMNVREKVAESLLYVYDTFGHSETGELEVSLSRQEIAEIAMTTKEQISRSLSEFETEGKIRMQGKKIFLTNLPELKRMIGVFNG